MKIYEEHYGKVYTQGHIYCKLIDGYFVIEQIDCDNVKIIVAFDNEKEQRDFITQELRDEYGGRVRFINSLPSDFLADVKSGNIKIYGGGIIKTIKNPSTLRELDEVTLRYQQEREVKKMNDKLKLIRADITTLEVDAIVNAANFMLKKGGGVCGAIFKAAGRELKKACKKIGMVAPGGSVIAPGFNLPVKYIIHTVGPVYNLVGGDDTLRKCYVNSIALAKEYGIRTLAFPCISTGHYRYPFSEAAKIALTTLREQDLDSFEKIYLVCYSESDYETYSEIMKETPYAEKKENQ